MPRRHEAVGSALAPLVGPAEDRRSVEAEPFSDTADAAAFGDYDFRGSRHGGTMRKTHIYVNAENALPMRHSPLCGKRIAGGIPAMTPESLKSELEKPGRSQTALGKMLGLDQSAVNRMVNGKREIKARELPVIEAYLAATGKPDDDSDVTPDLPPEIDARSDLAGVIMIPEYDVRLSAGDGFIVDAETTRREWPYPRFLIEDQLGMTPSRATVQEVIGDSMEPTLSSGDFVIIDRNDARIGNPGIFAVWDGDALVVKRLERVPGSSPRQVRIRSDNPLHGEYLVSEEEVRIIGRIRWITRRA